MTHPAFSAALEADRAELNQRFKLRSSQGSPLDPQAFTQHLTTRVEPIVAAVADRFPEYARLATRELYHVSLELFRAGYWTTQSRLPELTRLWQDVLPKLGHLVARQPERVSGALSNALVNLSSYPVRLDQWLIELGAIGDLCEDVSQLLEVSGVLAWRSGMTLLRQSSLRSLQHLPLTLACRAIGLPQSQSPAEWNETLARIASDRWFDPVASTRTVTTASIQEAARVADYRGLGGGLMDLPLVFLHQGQLHVTDRSASWRIEVDCYGCILQATSELLQPPSNPSKAAASSIDATGKVVWHDRQPTFNAKLHYLADSNSQAFDGQTLAVTLPTSFHVYLLTVNNVARLSEPSDRRG